MPDRLVRLAQLKVASLLKAKRSLHQVPACWISKLDQKG